MSQNLLKNKRIFWPATLISMLETMSSKIDDLNDENIPKSYINKLEKAYSVIAEVNEVARKQEVNK